MFSELIRVYEQQKEDMWLENEKRVCVHMYTINLIGKLPKEKQSLLQNVETKKDKRKVSRETGLKDDLGATSQCRFFL
jgi:hypothetical protein